MEIVLVLIGIFAGFLACWGILKIKYEKQKGIPVSEFELLKEKNTGLTIEISRAEERQKLIEGNLNSVTSELNQERNKVLELNKINSSLKSDYNNIKEKLEQQKTEIEALQQKFTAEFKNIANEILEDKSKRFTEQNRVNISEILKPLNEKIKDFEKKVEDTYEKENRQRFSLEKEIKNLYELNVQMSKEANNLTQALKGQSKVQGNWGEFILEAVLEKSGLSKGREYTIQESLKTEDGKRYQPDVIVYLPENKCLIIDSKVTLTAYERYCSAEDEAQRAVYLKEHISSLRNHIRNLGDKNYQNLYQLKSLDFVLMFLPIEPAFSLAVQNDLNLFNEAFEKNVVLVSPSTLLATLRTIASIWRQENQNRNALEIAKQGGALYDKFVSFVEDLISIGKKLDSTKESYYDAMKKLYDGGGNLIRKVENIKSLGAKATKKLPQNLLDRALEQNELTELTEEN